MNGDLGFLLGTLFGLAIAKLSSMFRLDAQPDPMRGTGRHLK